MDQIGDAAGAAASIGPIGVLLFAALVAVGGVCALLWRQNIRHLETIDTLRDKIEKIQIERMQDARAQQPVLDKLVEAMRSFDSQLRERPTERSIRDLIDLFDRQYSKRPTPPR